MITLPWYGAVAAAFVVALAAAIVVLIIQATREIHAESAWADIEGVVDALDRGIEQQRPAVVEVSEQLARVTGLPVEVIDASIAEGRARRELDEAQRAAISAYADDLSARMTAQYFDAVLTRTSGQYLDEPTPIHDRLVAEQRAEEQAGIRRRVEELGIDWSVTG